MSRRALVKKRIILPDPLCKSGLIAKFVNVVMKRGKKAAAERIVYGALEKAVATISGKEAKGGVEDKLELFSQALENVRPRVEVRSRPVGGTTYQIPVEVNLARGDALAMRWLVSCAALRGEKDMESRLAAEILEAKDNRGGAVKKRTDMHKMVEANRAFAHYRW